MTRKQWTRQTGRDRRDVEIRARVSPDFSDQVDALTVRLGINRSELLRRVLAEAVRVFGQKEGQI